jgi:DNA adenine methylase
MKYLGSKNKIAKYILPIMLEYRGDRTWIEPFVGGANTIDKVYGKRIGNDKNEYVVALLNALKNGWTPPIEVSEEFYNEVKQNRENYPKELVGYFGTQLVFGNIWFGSFRRDNTGNRKYDLEAYNNVMKQQPNLKGIEFVCGDYKDLQIPNNSLIYCDPPYKGSRPYIGENKIIHLEFWEWCREKLNEGHIIFVSEYEAPTDFECIWSKEVVVSGNNIHKEKLTNTEKLFVLKSEGEKRKEKDFTVVTSFGDGM